MIELQVVDDAGREVAFVRWDAGEVDIVRSVERLRPTFMKWRMYGLSSWDRDSLSLVETLPSDPHFLPRIAGYLRDQFAFATNLVMYGARATEGAALPYLTPATSGHATQKNRVSKLGQPLFGPRRAGTPGTLNRVMEANAQWRAG